MAAVPTALVESTLTFWSVAPNMASYASAYDQYKNGLGDQADVVLASVQTLQSVAAPLATWYNNMQTPVTGFGGFVSKIGAPLAGIAFVKDTSDMVKQWNDNGYVKPEELLSLLGNTSALGSVPIKRIPIRANV